MSDADNATRALESNIQHETSPLNENSGGPKPAMGDCCTSDRPTPKGKSSTGEIIKINDVECYISKPSDYPHISARLLLLLTGGTGLHSTNNQIQCDQFASEGYVVVMPDLFGGDSAPNATGLEDEIDVTSNSFLDIFKLRAVETAKSFMIDMWLARHTEEKVMPLLYSVINGVKEKFSAAVQTGEGIYAVGYCFGGRYILLLSQERQQVTDSMDAEAGAIRKGPLIKVGVLAHPTSVAQKDFVGLKAPISMICVENDPLFPDELRVFGEDTMEKDALEHEIKVYPGVPHGFAIAGDYPQHNIKDTQAVAYEQVVAWLKTH